jgi:hypothetical protein
VELAPSIIPVNIHKSGGTYSFSNVDNGDYTLIVTDSNECVFEVQITVNPFITTTTTTIVLNDLIIVGQAQDILLTFDPAGTNRNNHYFGDNPTDTNITLYLWFKTLNGEPLISSKTLSYSINATMSGESKFTYLDVSDQIHTEVTESIIGPASTIYGNITLKSGFIESYFKYKYDKDLIIPDFQINLSSYSDWLSNNIPLTGGTNIYGVTSIDNNDVIMKF